MSIENSMMIGMAGRGGEVRSFDSQGPNTQLKALVEEGIRKGNTKLMKVDKKGQASESNGLNTMNTAALIDITV